MKAVVARAYGPPESLLLEDLPSAAAQPDEVCVKTHYAGVSFVDVLFAAGKHQSKPPLPFTPCSEFSGEVMAVGSNVTHVKAGDLVCGGRMGGILAEEVTVAASRVQKLPAGINMQQAAVLRASYLTAWYSLVTCGQIAKGDKVLVLGAAGAVGIASCQLARHLGAEVIASASTDAKRQFTLQYGAHHAIDNHAEDWRDHLRALTDNQGVNVIIDPVGGEITERAFRAIAYQGRHVIVGFAAGEIPKIATNLPLMKGASLTGALTSYYEEREPEACLETRAHLLTLLADGAIAPPIGQVFEFEDYVAAMQAAAGGKVLGRVLIKIAGT